eukprot:3935215-Rhodomonas_salina.1
MGVVVGRGLLFELCARTALRITLQNSRTASCEKQNSTAELWVLRWHTRSSTQPRSSMQPLPLPLSACAQLLSFFRSHLFASSLCCPSSLSLPPSLPLPP